MRPWWEAVDVSHWPERQVEAAGSSTALWLEDPTTGSAWLHKDTTIPKNGIEQGEDWAEAVATQVAMALGVPCAPVRLCTRDGRRGSLSQDLRLKGYSFWPANLWLPGRAPGYVPHTEDVTGVDPDRPGVKRPGHTLTNYRRALAVTSVPNNFEGVADDGFDVLAGFHVLDAIVANRDRHTENWAVLEPQVGSEPTLLAPSFDHGGSLGYNVADRKREELLNTGGIEEWVSKGTAHRLEHGGGTPKVSLVDAAVAALTLASPGARVWWRDQVAQLDLGPVLADVRGGRIESMSEPGRIFTAEVLERNLRRVRHAVAAAE